MEKNNKKRLLALIEILRRYSNEEKHLKLSEIISYLEQKDISVNNRKTLYDDFKTLNECDINVEHDNDGYYLLDAPFNLSEIKIIQDSIYSLKNLDKNFINDLNKKLYTFISYDEEELLESLKYENRHKDKKLLHQMESILDAIKRNRMISVKRNGGKSENVFPVFIHRANDYYYFYYHYKDSRKLYHFRFDSIATINIKDEIDELNITRKEILDKINESSNSFAKNDSSEIKIKVLNDNENIISRFKDDFPNVIINDDIVSIKVSLNNVLYSKLFAYGNNIKIIDKKIADKYETYLKEVLAIYH